MIETALKYLLKFLVAKITGEVGDMLAISLIRTIVKNTKWTWDDEWLKEFEQLRDKK